MSKGKVKWYNKTKGFGFIATDDGQDVFVHHTSLADSFAGLQENQEVTFETEEGEKGLKAVNVQTL